MSVVIAVYMVDFIYIEVDAYVYRLSYHYGLCQDEAEKAFEFSVKAADIAVAQCQFEDGLVLLKKAHRVASSKEQMQTLLNSVRGGIAAICEKAEVSKFFRTAIFMNKDVSQNHQKYTALENRLVRKLDVLQPRDNSTVDTLVVPNSEGTVQVAPLAAVADTQKNVTEVPSFGGDESVIVKTSPCCTIC